MDIIAKITEELGVKKPQVEAAVKLIDEGNTIPFIARYRKEATGSLNDEQLRDLDERLKYLRTLEEKKDAVLKSIEEQGKLTEDLRDKIVAAQTMVAVDDLYLPYRPKRKTRASVAREKGLEPLAQLFLAQNSTRSPEEEAAAFVNIEKGVEDVKAAIQGAKDMIAESVSDNADYRSFIREVTFEEGSIDATQKDKDEKGVYEMYYDYSEPVKSVPDHRILALNRGEAEKVLTVKITAPVDRILSYLKKQLIENPSAQAAKVLEEASIDAYERLIAPAIERDIRNELTEKAQDGAIAVFGKNLSQLLMQPPIAGKTVLGWDPAFRTGCKLAIVDPTGKVLDTKVIYPTAPQNKVEEAKREIKKLIDRYHVDLISVGNGTASRESEALIAAWIKEFNLPLSYVIVNEAGASVYSASKLATEEFPNFDVGQRSAASIARRLQDPLAELVKIAPQSIGVGQYQHDMNQKKLSEALSGVVEDCVNKVGVDLNTASAPLLEYVSGINKTIARNIVDFREENGEFESRAQLKKVPKLGPKAFEQCAGFLRIHGGKNPLDDTSVHPESYEAAKKLMEKIGITVEDIRTMQKKQRTEKKPGASAGATDDLSGKESAQKTRSGRGEKAGGYVVRHTNTAMGAALAAALGQMQADSGRETLPASSKGTAESKGTAGSKGDAGSTGFESVKGDRKGGNRSTAQGETETKGGNLLHKISNREKLAEELGIGVITLEDIVSELEKPSRDPRENMPAPILRQDVLDMKDLQPGMILKGTVRNIIDFGCFVDIGVHQDGLVHISQITDRYIKHPLEAVSVGDVVRVKVLSVDPVKKRIGLTMKL